MNPPPTPKDSLSIERTVGTLQISSNSCFSVPKQVSAPPSLKFSKLSYTILQNIYKKILKITQT